MPERNPVPTLHSIVSASISEKIRTYNDQHKKKCPFCSPTVKAEMQPGLWDILCSIIPGTTEVSKLTDNLKPSDCPVIFNAVDQIISCIPPTDVKESLSNILAGDKTTEYSVEYNALQMICIDLDLSNSSKLTDLLKQYQLTKVKIGLSGFRTQFIHLERVIRTSEMLVSLDFGLISPSESILEFIGDHCKCIKEIYSLRIRNCLFRSPVRDKRTIYNFQMRKVSTIYGDLRGLGVDERYNVIANLFLILRWCPNVFVIKKDNVEVEVLKMIHKNFGYTHPHLKHVTFELATRKKLNWLLNKYPTVTHLDIRRSIQGLQYITLRDFKHLLSLDIVCDYDYLRPFLERRGTQLEYFRLTTPVPPVSVLNLNELRQSLLSKCYSVESELQKGFISSNSKVFRMSRNFYFAVWKLQSTAKQ